VWSRPGDTVLIEEFGHNYYFETGSMSAIAGVQPRLLQVEQHVLEGRFRIICEFLLAFIHSKYCVLPTWPEACLHGKFTAVGSIMGNGV